MRRGRERETNVVSLDCGRQPDQVCLATRAAIAGAESFRQDAARGVLEQERPILRARQKGILIACSDHEPGVRQQSESLDDSPEQTELDALMRAAAARVNPDNILSLNRF